MIPVRTKKLREYGQAWLDAEEAQKIANEKQSAVKRLADHYLLDTLRYESPHPSLVMDDGIVLTFKFTGSRENPIEVIKTKLLEEGPDA